MSYDLRFETKVDNSQDLAKVDALIAKLSASTKVAAGDLKIFEQVLKSDVAAGNSLSASLSTIAATSKGGFEGLAAIAKQAQTFGVAATEAASATTRFTASTVALGQAHSHAVPQIAAASGAIRVFEGALPIRAVERFAVTTLGLGPLLQAAFPIIGAVALGEELYRTWTKFDPLIKAEKEAAAKTKELDAAFASLGKRLEHLQIQEITDQFGKIAGAKLAAFYAGTNAAEDQARITTLDRQIAKLKDDLRGPSTTATVLGAIPGFAGPAELAKRSKAAIETELRPLQAEREGLALKVRVDRRETSKDLADATKDAALDAKRAAKEAATLARETHNAAVSYENAANNAAEIGPVARKFAERSELLQKRGPFTGADQSGIDAATVNYVQTELGREADKQRKFPLVMSDEGLRRAGIGGSLEGALQPSGYKFREKGTAHEEAEITKSLHELFQNVLRDIKTTNAEADRRTREEGAEQVRSARAGGAFAQRLTSLDPRLGAAQKIAELKREELATAQEVLRIELEHAAVLSTEKERGDAADKARLANELELQQIREKNVERIAELENKHLEEFRSLVGGLFESIASRQPGAIPNFVKSQVLNQTRIVTENAAQQYLLPTLKQVGQATGINSALTKGTWLEGAGKSPLDTSAGKLTVAGAELSSAATSLVGAAHAIAAGGTGAGGGGIGAPLAGTVLGADGLPIRGTNTSLLPNVFTSGLSNFGSGASSVLKGYGLSTLTDPGFNLSTRVGAGVGLAGAGLAGAYGVYSGLKQGGAGGDLKAAGSAAGLAGAVVSNVSHLLQAASPLLSAIPVVGSIAALALPLLGGFFNGPQRRANEISKELSEAQYNAPQALNVTQTSSGTFADFDARGNLRGSTFSAIPTVRQQTTWEQTHGLFGGPPSFFQVPGGQTSQFGAPVAPPVVYNTTINAMDVQSFADFAHKNNAAIGNAAATALQNTHGRLSSEVQRAVRP